ncbi:MAG: AAA family ATPase [Thermomicrobia bacterium]|nr:AAA family ATPase [Thermomicrobia bacterium]
MARLTETFSDYGIEIPPNARGNVKTQCPQCSHTRQRAHIRERCLSVDTESGLWRCHHCEWSGKLKEDRPTPMRPNVRVPEPPVTPIPPAFSQIGERGLAWFAKRGISEQIVQRFGIYSERHYFPGAESELPALCFPYNVNGELVNVKYRAATEKHFTMVKGARKTFFNLDAVRDAEAVVIVEGEMDVLALAAAGIPHAISVPNGANSLTDEVMESAAVLAERKDVRFILAGDADEKGRILETELARRFGHERCALVAWPEGCKDANDTLMAHGAIRVAECLRLATPYPVAGLIAMDDLAEGYWTYFADGAEPGTATGWRAFDGLYSVREGEITVVTGIPGSGKSALIDDLAIHLATREGWRIGVFSPENQPTYRHAAMLAAKYVGAPFLSGPTPRMSAEEADTAHRWLRDHFTFILPEEPTVDAVLTLARTLVYRAGIKGLIIDPWNEMDHSRPPALTETEYISQCLTRIRQFARTNRVHIWVVAHPTKLVKGNDGNYPVPTPYDIAGSAHWYNKADNALSVYRDKTDPTQPTTVHVQKIRFSEIGRIGMADLRYDVPTGRFLWR